MGKREVWQYSMRAVLNAVNKVLKENKINYSFRRKRGKIIYPYLVGEIYETGSDDESGITEYEFLLNGFDREEEDTRLLELAENVEAMFPKTGGRLLQVKNGGMCIWYDKTIPDIPTGMDTELNRIQIMLKVKRWKGGL